MKKIKRKMLFVMMLFVCSIGFSNLVHGLEEGLEQSLFLPASHWLSRRISENKPYLSGVAKAKADVGHVIICKKWGNEAYTNNANEVLIKVPLKPFEVEEGSYNNFPEGQKGGYVTFIVKFSEPQTNNLVEEQVSEVVEGGVVFSYYDQKTIDQQMDTALEKPENEAYFWINFGGAKRELVSLPCNGSGYVITSADGKQKVFFNLSYCGNLGISQYTFTPWEKVQEKIEHWHRQQTVRTTVGSGTFDLSRIKFGTRG
jgi:hypothetical protein